MDTDYVRKQTLLKELLAPVFTIQMGWHRWNDTTKIKWARKLSDACQETIFVCNNEIKRLERNNAEGRGRPDTSPNDQ